MRRGDVWFATLPQHNVDHHSCEAGVRPVVIVSSNAGCRTSSVVTVCPLTTKIKPLTCNIDVSWSGDGRPNQVLTNQIVTIPKECLLYYKGFLSNREQKLVEDGICYSLQLRR